MTELFITIFSIAFRNLLQHRPAHAVPGAGAGRR